MDNIFPEDAVINISDGIIKEIDLGRNDVFVTIAYNHCINCQMAENNVRLLITPNTLIFDESGNEIPITDLKVGMTVNAAFSSAMTRSIPPQANAFMIRIVKRTEEDNVTIGNIIDIDRRNRTLTTISDENLSSIIQFNVPMDAIILSRNGNQLNFTQLIPGSRVRIRHANFMTMSIPPQTTAYEIRVIN